MNWIKSREYRTMRQVFQLTVLLNYVLTGIYALQQEHIYELPVDEPDISTPLHSDAGYGSRVQTSLDVAKATLLARLLYGTSGPGRRKRSLDTLEAILTHATDDLFSENVDSGKQSVNMGAQRDMNHVRQYEPEVYYFSKL